MQQKLNFEEIEVQIFGGTKHTQKNKLLLNY